MKKLLQFLLVLALILSPQLALAGDAKKSAHIHRVSTKEEVVAFNTNSLKFHNLSCTWAARCTRNCITVPKSEAIKRGGIPCKVCGG